MSNVQIIKSLEIRHLLGIRNYNLEIILRFCIF